MFVERAGTETSGSFMNVGTFLRMRGKVAESLVWYRRALDEHEQDPDHDCDNACPVFREEVRSREAILQDK